LWVAAQLGALPITVEPYYSELEVYAEKGEQQPKKKRDQDGDDSDDDVFEDAVENLEENGQEEEDPPVIAQEDKPKLSIVVELMANGYVLNDRIIEKAKDFDGSTSFCFLVEKQPPKITSLFLEQRGITDSFKRYIIAVHNKGSEINEKYEVVDKAQEYANKATGKAKEIASGIDEKYHVKDKLLVAKEEAQVWFDLPFHFKHSSHDNFE